jgi:hypothetical protein
MCVCDALFTSAFGHKSVTVKGINLSAWIGTLPLVLAGLLYVMQSFGYFFIVKRIGMTIAFVGYTIGNIGLLIDYYEMRGD